ncbi:MAG: Crp/Fnr family transcriptional regulator, partial [Dehalococcoidia bacterium]|nr:Crp/Fnr family transcriptional regulator [Dehalococcoidia bacterium]
RKGEIIYREGRRAEFLYVILEGRVKIYKVSQIGKAFIIDIRTKGDNICMFACICNMQGYATAEALEDTLIAKIHRNEILQLLATNHEFNLRIMELEGKRLYRLYDKLVELAAFATNQRLIKTIKYLSSTYGNTLNFTHQDLSDMCGTTLETTTRLLSRLKATGVLISIRGRIIIMDEQGLRNLTE